MLPLLQVHRTDTLTIGSCRPTAELMATVRRQATAVVGLSMSLVSLVTLFETLKAYNVGSGRILIDRQLGPMLGGELWIERVAADVSTDTPGAHVKGPGLN